MIPLPPDRSPETVQAELRAVTEALERIAANRGLLHELPLEDRVRLLSAAGAVFCPDVADRRRQTKAKIKPRIKFRA